MVVNYAPRAITYTPNIFTIQVTGIYLRVEPAVPEQPSSFFNVLTYRHKRIY